MLTIKNLRDITVYKKKETSISFKIGSDHYLLHAYDEGFVTLYKKELSPTGRYDLVELMYSKEAPHISSFVGYMPKGRTYRSITADFVYKLTLYGFADSMYTNKAANARRLIAHKKKQLKYCNEMIASLSTDISILSKLY